MNDQVRLMAIAFGFHIFHLIRKEHFKISLLYNIHFARFIFLMNFAFKVLNILNLYIFCLWNMLHESYCSKWQSQIQCTQKGISISQAAPLHNVHKHTGTIEGPADCPHCPRPHWQRDWCGLEIKTLCLGMHLLILQSHIVRAILVSEKVRE